MTTAIDTRPGPGPLRTRSLGGDGGETALALSRARRPTRGPSTSLAAFREAARRLFRARVGERQAALDAVVARIHLSRYPQDCVHELAVEAVRRGGPYGLDLAAHVLALVPVPLQDYIDDCFSTDGPRRASDRRLPYPRYREDDELWGVLLDALARTPADAVPTTAVLSTLRRVAESATAGMVGGLAAAAASLADRGDAERSRAVAFLNRLLALRPGGRDLSATGRQAVEGAIADLTG